MNDRLAHPPSEQERRESNSYLASLHPGNRFRLMMGMPLLPEPEKTMNNEEKLATPVRTFLFFREGGFYQLQLPEATVSDNADCNPGTLKVVDAATGEVVWTPKP